MRPQSFDEDCAEDWSRWVLENGLPELPGADLDVGQSVPVAFWVGPTTAAVLHIRRVFWDDDEEAITETDVEMFCLVDNRWQGSGSGGAGGWAEGVPPLLPPPMAARHAALDGMQSGGSVELGCKALWGEVGVDVAMAEVDQAGKVTRRPIEAPAGMAVVSGEYGAPFTVRLFTASGDVIAQIDEPAGSDDGGASPEDFGGPAGAQPDGTYFTRSVTIKVRRTR